MKYAGEIIKEAREKKGISLKDLFDRSGINIGTLKSIEDGDNQNPQLNTLKVISAILEVPLPQLVADWEEDAKWASAGIDQFAATYKEVLTPREIVELHQIINGYISLRKVAKLAQESLRPTGEK